MGWLFTAAIDGQWSKCGELRPGQIRKHVLRGHTLDPTTFAAADPIVEKIADAVDAALLSDQLADLRRLLEELSKALGQRYSAELNVSLQIFDREGERGIPLLNTGLSTTDDGPLYRTSGDSTPQRYLVGNEIQVVPHATALAVGIGGISNSTTAFVNIEVHFCW